MKISLRIALGIAGSALVFGLSGGMAHAQSQAQGSRSAGKAPSTVHSQYRPNRHRHHPQPPPGYVVEVAPPLLSPNSLGLIEKDFQAMRRTSPRPNEFLGGRWNPSYQVVPPATIVTPPAYVYPPYGYGYGYGIGYGTGYGYGGTTVNVGVGVIPVPVPVPQAQTQAQTQAELDNLRDRSQALRRANTQQSTASRPQAAPSTTSEKPAASGNFYLQKNQGKETLSDALDDIRKAWLNGDFARLKNRLKADGKVRIFVNGEFKQEQATPAFSDLVRQAMEQIDTVSFEFDRPASEEGGRVFVSGQHTFLDAEKNKHTTHVSYVLERDGDRWQIVETGSGTAPIKDHK